MQTCRDSAELGSSAPLIADRLSRGSRNALASLITIMRNTWDDGRSIRRRVARGNGRSRGAESTDASDSRNPPTHAEESCRGRRAQDFIADQHWTPCVYHRCMVAELGFRTELHWLPSFSSRVLPRCSSSHGFAVQAISSRSGGETSS